MTVTPGLRLREARIQAGMTQKQLAVEMSALKLGNISRSTIAEWETGGTKDIGAENLLKACFVLDVEPYNMIGLTRRKNDV